MSEDDLPALVAAVERESEHPLAGAIMRFADDRGVPAFEPAYGVMLGPEIAALD